MPRQVRALDCGAGVGRVTQEILIKFFDFIDLIEPAKNFIEEAKVRCKNLKHKGNRVDKFYQSTL